MTRVQMVLVVLALAAVESVWANLSDGEGSETGAHPNDVPLDISHRGLQVESGAYEDANHDGTTNPCRYDRQDYCCDWSCTYCGPQDYCVHHSPFQTHSGVCNPDYDSGVCENYFVETGVEIEGRPHAGGLSSGVGAALTGSNAVVDMRVTRSGSGTHHGAGTLLGWKVDSVRYHDTSGGLSSDNFCRINFDNGGSWNVPMSEVTILGSSSRSTTVVHEGYEYRTIMDGIEVDTNRDVCHTSSMWLALPDGYELAPDTSEIVNEVVAAHLWSTDVMVLSSMKAYGTARFSTGIEYGDHQDKAVSRLDPHGETLWSCPWTCYQILVRRPTTGAPPPPAPSGSGFGSDPCAGNGVQIGAGRLSFDDGYSNSMSCRWTATCANGALPTISFSTFNTERSYDIVSIYDGPSSHDTRIGRYSGSSEPPDICASGSDMLIQFITDGSVTRPDGPFDADIICGDPCPTPSPPPGMTFGVGDSVQVRPSVDSAAYGWGGVDHGDCGTVVYINSGTGDATIDFPAQSAWHARVTELEPCGGVRLSESAAPRATDDADDTELQSETRTRLERYESLLLVAFVIISLMIFVMCCMGCRLRKASAGGHTNTVAVPAQAATQPVVPVVMATVMAAPIERRGSLEPLAPTAPSSVTQAVAVQPDREVLPEGTPTQRVGAAAAGGTCPEWATPCRDGAECRLHRDKQHALRFWHPASWHHPESGVASLGDVV